VSVVDMKLVKPPYVSEGTKSTKQSIPSVEGNQVDCSCWGVWM